MILHYRVGNEYVRLWIDKERTVRFQSRQSGSEWLPISELFNNGDQLRGEKARVARMDYLEMVSVTNHIPDLEIVAHYWTGQLRRFGAVLVQTDNEP